LVQVDAPATQKPVTFDKDLFWVSLAQAQKTELNSEGLSTTFSSSASNSRAFVDVGWCTPDIDLNGTTWMGWQKGKAWVYRGETGNFKVADGIQDQGTKYGPAFGPEATITALRHSPTTLEFFLNGRSNGLAEIPPENAIPEEAIPCAGSCSAIDIRLPSNIPPTPPPTPPPPPTPVQGAVVVKTCIPGDRSQQWHYDPAIAHITHISGGGLATSTVPGAAAGDFASVVLDQRSAGDALWWSPDLALGYIHSGSNSPMRCNCIAVCGDPS
jgi:hypothetical protein